MLINNDQKKKQVLVTGGAGYIGSQMVFTLLHAGYQPIVLDRVKPKIAFCEAVQGEVADMDLLSTLFSRYDFCAVMHFAAYINVESSAAFPLQYYQNNVAATLNLLAVMQRYQVKHLIFSSTAAVYGEPMTTPITETHPLNPVNVYGRTKWMMEQIIQDVASNGSLNYAILRYFNATGADPTGRIGECHEPETHLIPLVLNVATGEKSHIQVNGCDYPTIDGTCVRDYVHVSDLCEGHLRALEVLLDGQASLLCNLGTGAGHTILQVVKAVERITGCTIPISIAAPRVGDPAVLIADAMRAKQLLQWIPQYPDVDTMIAHAWAYKLACTSFAKGNAQNC